MKKFVVVLLIVVFAGIGLKGNDSHPFNINDMLKMERISDVQLSPDNKSLVFVMRKTDLKNNRGVSDLWLVSSDGSGLKQLTNDNAADFNPRWSVDGRIIWFLSSRSGSVQVWKINPDNNKIIQETDLPLSCQNLIISPDNQKIAFTVDVFPKLSIRETRKELDRLKKKKASGVIYKNLLFRHWDTWEDGLRSHLFVKDIDGNKIHDLMKGMDVDTPLRPFGGPEEISFTPDGKSMIFTASNQGKKRAWTTNYDLFEVDVDSLSKPKSITLNNKAWDSMPLFSPDGKYLVYLAMERPGFEADKFNIMLRQWPDGKEKILAKDWDRSPSALAWAKNSKKLYAVAPDLGQRSLFEINLKNGKWQRLISQGTVGSLNVGKKRIFFGYDTLKSPVEIFSIRNNGKDQKQLTHFNDKNIQKAKMGDYEQFKFKGWNNEDVYCYIVKPVGFTKGQKYPVAFLIHGGPQGSFGNHFHYRWNPQAYAGAGFACVMVDFHGSVGYGQKFTDSITGDWGGKPLIDLKKGLKAAIERYSFMDKDNVVALGASYGGYMINWIAGNWPDRFKCLVNHDGNLDERLAYFDTEELWFPEWEHGGTPWDNPEGYEKHNPVNFVKNWKTPMLVIHGALDFRVVETQGFSTFTALQRMGIPSKLLYFPGENHWVLKPHNSIQWHKTVIDWLKHWIKK